MGECHHYLKHCIHEKNVLFLLNSAYCLNSLDDDFYSKCKSIIFQTNSLSILENEGFANLHPDILIDIISSTQFEAKEEKIWNSCVQWAENVIAKNIKFPKKNGQILGMKTECEKDADENENDDDAKENKLEQISEHYFYRKDGKELDMEWILK